MLGMRGMELKTKQKRFSNITANTLLGRASVNNGEVQEITIGSGLILNGTTLLTIGKGVTDGDKGDITVSNDNSTWTIDNNAITTSKIGDAQVTIPKLNVTGTPNNSTYLRGDGTWATLSAGNPGTVTSIGLSLPNIFSVTGSPITSSGTLSASFVSQSPNLVFASPSASSGIPLFRTLVSADIPFLPASIINSGVFDVARLGTGTPSNSTYLRGDGTWTSIVGLTDSDKGDITVSNNGSTWTIDNNSITTAKIADTQITIPKLNVTGTPSNSTYLRGDGTWTSIIGLTDGDKGDITVSNNGATWTIDNSAITTAKIGDAQVTLAKFNTTGTPSNSTYLRGDGTWTSIVGLTDGDKGDVTLSNNGSTWTINNDAVTFAKLQNIATNRLLGRTSISSGDVEEITIGSGLNLSSGVLSIQSQTDFISGHIERASNKTYCLDLSAKRSYIINNLSIVCDSGSVSASLQLNTTSVTGIASFTVNQSLLTLDATANNTASIGNQLNLVLSSNNDALDVKFTLQITYA